MTVTAVLMSGLSACSDPAQPATLPTKAATTTAAPTTSTPEPPTPEDEVEEFARDYFAELERAVLTLDVSRLKRLSTKGCPCYRHVRVVKAIRRDGEHVPKFDVRLDQVVTRELNPKDAVVGVRFEISAYQLLDANGNVVDDFEPVSGNWDLSLIEGPQGWFIGNIIDLGG